MDMLLYQLGYLKNLFTLLRYPQHCWGKGVTNSSTVAYKLYISVYKAFNPFKMAHWIHLHNIIGQLIRSHMHSISFVIQITQG